MGKELENFELNYSKFCGTNYSLGVANGLDALRLIFKEISVKISVLLIFKEMFCNSIKFIILAIKFIFLSF